MNRSFAHRCCRSRDHPHQMIFTSAQPSHQVSREREKAEKSICSSVSIVSTQVAPWLACRLQGKNFRAVAKCSHQGNPTNDNRSPAASRTQIYVHRLIPVSINKKRGQQ